jgi:putative ABC transport system ATP-binding protein
MIETQDLGYQYPGGGVLRFPDVRLPQGDTLLLRGPSGSGKSTWLALAAGLRRPSCGEIIVAGRALSGLTPRALDAWRGAQVGVLPQRLHLSAALSVRENLALVYWAAGLPSDEAAIDAALAALGLSALAARLPRELSVGQAQRVALARAMLRRPRVLLADEPTASLDDAACAEALGQLAATAQRCGATLVIATHDARVHAAWPDARVLSFAPVSGDVASGGFGPVQREAA